MDASGLRIFARPKEDSFDDFRNQAQDRDPWIDPGAKSFVPSPGLAISTAPTPAMHSPRLLCTLSLLCALIRLRTLRPFESAPSHWLPSVVAPETGFTIHYRKSVLPINVKVCSLLRMPRSINPLKNS